MILTLIGILLAVISSVCSAYANVLLKLSHNNVSNSMVTIKQLIDPSLPHT